MSTRQALTNVAAVCTLGNADGRIPAQTWHCMAQKTAAAAAVARLRKQQGCGARATPCVSTQSGCILCPANWAVCQRPGHRKVLRAGTCARAVHLFLVPVAKNNSSDTGGCPAWCARAAMLFAPSMPQHTPTTGQLQPRSKEANPAVCVIPASQLRSVPGCRGTSAAAKRKLQYRASHLVACQQHCPTVASTVHTMARLGLIDLCELRFRLVGPGLSKRPTACACLSQYAVTHHIFDLSYALLELGTVTALRRRKHVRFISECTETRQIVVPELSRVRSSPC